jgi:hypothetical protein
MILHSYLQSIYNKVVQGEKYGYSLTPYFIVLMVLVAQVAQI